VASQCQSLDLVVPAVDGHSVLLIGPAEEPDQWLSRLNEHLADMRDETGNAQLPPVELKWMGTWAYPKEREKIMAATVNKTMGVPAGV